MQCFGLISVIASVLFCYRSLAVHSLDAIISCPSAPLALITSLERHPLSRKRLTVHRFRTRSSPTTLPVLAFAQKQLPRPFADTSFPPAARRFGGSLFLLTPGRFRTATITAHPARYETRRRRSTNDCPSKLAPRHCPALRLEEFEVGQDDATKRSAESGTFHTAAVPTFFGRD